MYVYTATLLAHTRPTHTPHTPSNNQHTGSSAASYDTLQPSSVALTPSAAGAGGPRAQLKPRTRGAKQPQCADMCPEEERHQRTVERQLHPYERIGPDHYATTPELAVKKYQRSREC